MKWFCWSVHYFDVDRWQSHVNVRLELCESFIEIYDTSAIHRCSWCFWVKVFKIRTNKNLLSLLQSYSMLEPWRVADFSCQLRFRHLSNSASLRRFFTANPLSHSPTWCVIWEWHVSNKIRRPVDAWRNSRYTQYLATLGPDFSIRSAIFDNNNKIIPRLELYVKMTYKYRLRSVFEVAEVDSRWVP